MSNYKEFMEHVGKLGVDKETVEYMQLYASGVTIHMSRFLEVFIKMMPDEARGVKDHEELLKKCENMDKDLFKKELAKFGTNMELMLGHMNDESIEEFRERMDELLKMKDEDVPKGMSEMRVALFNASLDLYKKIRS